MLHWCCKWIDWRWKVSIYFEFRIYKNFPEPLPWSSRKKVFSNKFKNVNYYQAKLSKDIKKELFRLTDIKIGKLKENSDLDDDEFLAHERENKMMQVIEYETKHDDDYWNNYDIEETTIRLDLTECLFDMLLNETVEIIEHVNLSRVAPQEYQYKSIYACDDLPKLSFQQTTEGEMSNINNNSS